MSVVLVPLYARAPLQTNRYIRNGLYPDANAMTFMQEETNRLLKLRTKSWSFFTPVDAVPTAAGNRWRAFLHTSSMHSYMQVRFVVASSRGASNPYVECRFTKSGLGITDATATYYAGSGAATDPDAPSYFGIGDTFTATTTVSNVVDTLTADQDYEVIFVETNGARLVSATIFEITQLADTDNGYLASGVQAGGPIYDNQRGDMIALLRTAWKRNAAPLITWSVQQDSAAVTTNGTTKNVVDTSVTSVSTASPGFTIDNRYRARVRNSSVGVNCRMWAYLKSSIGTATAKLLLVDSTGATIATCSTTSTTAGWVDSGQFRLPATKAKYDLMAALTNIGTATVYAASIFAYET